MALPSYSAFAHVQVAVHEGEVSGVNPDAGIPSGSSDSGVPAQRPYAHHANAIAAIRHSLQHTTCEFQSASCNMRRATCAEQHARSATSNMQQTNMVGAMEPMTRFTSHFGPYVDCVFRTPLTLLPGNTTYWSAFLNLRAKPLAQTTGLFF